MNDELHSARPIDYLLLLFKRRRRFRVTGASMSPLLQDGDEVLVDLRAYRHQSPRLGDIVIARHPFRTHIKPIKRVTAVLEDGRLYLQGDNPNSLESEDSRSFGPVQPTAILGRVTHHFP